MGAFEQSIFINANSTTVERCVCDRNLMHQWLNPVLRCEPLGEIWSTELNSQTKFIIQVPLLQPSLISTVVERRPGLVVWAFTGFFIGQDRWECIPEASGTQLVNRFEFEISNPLVAFGFQTFAADWTKKDMKAQLKRLKQVAERLG
ncbi:MAG: SRPBCC family protein [Symploca sp. SIO2G7]|nr:SRPBCC family protein [Symploca sp. SIO2G7]